MESILQVLRKLELNVLGIVYDDLSPAIELPNLWELRYYGYITPKATPLPSLRTPRLQYLEIMHQRLSLHPVYEQVNRNWPGNTRKSISGYKHYSTSRNNSAKNFPEDVEKVDPLLPAIHQSLRFGSFAYIWAILLGNNITFKLMTFPALNDSTVRYPTYGWSKHHSSRNFICCGHQEGRIKHPTETAQFERYSQIPGAQRVLNKLKALDIYSHANRFHETSLSGKMTMSFEKWIPYLTSLRMIVFPRMWDCIGCFIDVLSHVPHMCPALTSLKYPNSWILLCHCLEVRNHLSMKDRSVQAIHTLHFPFEVHRNISGPLRDALSGEFAAPFVAIPAQPWGLHDLLPQIPDDKERPQENACVSCYRSGNTFECEGR